jgi:hypothetical protein
MATTLDALHLLLIAFAFAGPIAGIVFVIHLVFRAIRRVIMQSGVATRPPSPVDIPDPFERFQFIFLDFRE